MANPTVTFGVILPAWSDAATPDGFTRVASAAEEAGFDAVWRGDHIVFPEHIPEGGPFARIDSVAYDVFQILSHVAAMTDGLHVGTNICVVPYRHPVHLAKLALTLDNLAEGRFEFGVGVGVHRAEFDVLDVPYEQRGARTDEFLELFERVCRSDTLAFEGPHHEFGRTGFYPRPVRAAGPPIWVGGESSAAVRRVAEYGTGWTTFHHSPEELGGMRERLLATWDDFDRNGEPGLATPVPVCPDRESDPAAAYLTGDCDHDTRVIEQYLTAGVTRLNVSFRGIPLDHRISLIDRLGEIISSIEST